MRYLRPISTDLYAHAHWADESDVLALQQDLTRRGRGRVVIPVTLQQDEKAAVRFTGEFVFSAH
jgi:thioesterase domain-containing protein